MEEIERSSRDNASSSTMEIGNYITNGVMLGRGAFGTVELAHEKKNANKTVAIKCISKANIIRENMGNQVSKEVSILKNLKHPNIVRIEQVYMSSDYLYICMEYLTGGELFSKLATGILLTEQVCQKYMFQLCDALQYCHGLNVCHRDIKPQNILLDDKDNAKLVDFGFASIMEIDVNKNLNKERVQRDSSDKNILGNKVTPEEEFKRSMEAPSVLMKETHTICGTSLYMAPEIMSRNTYMGDKVDIWALGTVCYFLLTGNVPFKSMDVKRDHYKTPENVSKLAIDFISKMLDVVPECRFSARNLLQHEWIKEYIENHHQERRRSSSSSDNNNRRISEETEDYDESTDDESEEELEFIISTTLELNKVMDKIINILKNHEWLVKIEHLGILKVSKLSDTGMNLIIIYVDKKNAESCSVCIKNGSVIRMASKQSKIDLKTLIILELS